MIFHADVCNLEDMQTVVDQAECRMGKLNGIIHAAGVTDKHQMIADLENIEGYFDEVMKAKVDGTISLSELIKDKKLDFVLCMSSLSAVSGGISYAGSARANSFLDYFAQRMASEGQPWYCVNWSALGNRK